MYYVMIGAGNKAQLREKKGLSLALGSNKLALLYSR